MLEKIIMAHHHGFCWGVKRAIKTARETARNRTGPVTILNEIVHNEAVVESFRRQGIGQEFSVEAVESGTLIISAHGVAPHVKKAAKARGLHLVDATCPLVSRIYKIINRVVHNGYHVIHYGDSSHDETRGIVGHAPDSITVVGSHEELSNLSLESEARLGLTVQTTVQVSEFAQIEKLARQKWPHIEVFNTVCDATTQRQTAIMDLAPNVDMVLVVGSTTSANSKRLARISDAICSRGILIGTADDIDEEWFAGETGVRKVGISAGASTPDFLVTEVIEKLVTISEGRAQVIVPEDMNIDPAGNRTDR
ncbi:MAG: 4-hydroxy-3-methylbut-2-enyl diphosphate reductase [bacterium]